MVIKIYDVRGRLVEELKLGGFTGKNTIMISVSEMVSGIYFCAITGNGKLLGVMKMVVVK